METVQQNGRFTLFSFKFLSIYSILYVFTPKHFLFFLYKCLNSLLIVFSERALNIENEKFLAFSILNTRTYISKQVYFEMF